MNALSLKAAAVKAHAEAHYEESFGWQEFVECYTNSELEEFVADCATVEEAVAMATTIAGIRTERCEDAQKEVF